MIKLLFKAWAVLCPSTNAAVPAALGVEWWHECLCQKKCGRAMGEVLANWLPQDSSKIVLAKCQCSSLAACQHLIHSPQVLMNLRCSRYQLNVHPKAPLLHTSSAPPRHTIICPTLQMNPVPGQLCPGASLCSVWCGKQAPYQSQWLLNSSVCWGFWPLWVWGSPYRVKGTPKSHRGDHGWATSCSSFAQRRRKAPKMSPQPSGCLCCQKRIYTHSFWRWPLCSCFPEVPGDSTVSHPPHQRLSTLAPPRRIYRVPLDSLGKHKSTLCLNRKGSSVFNRAFRMKWSDHGTASAISRLTCSPVPKTRSSMWPAWCVRAKTNWDCPSATIDDT